MSTNCAMLNMNSLFGTNSNLIGSFIQVVSTSHPEYWLTRRAKEIWKGANREPEKKKTNIYGKKGICPMWSIDNNRIKKINERMDKRY